MVDILIFEMGPRDGLQNEKTIISTQDKIKLVNMLSETGLKKIETASFVSPKWVPQMADSAEVMEGITRNKAVLYTALTPNVKGYERAKLARADEVAIFASASEGFSKANLNASRADALEMFRPVAEAARHDGIPVRGYVSCITDCPYDGKIAPQAVAKTAKALFEMGCYEVSLGDTIGKATPETLLPMLDAVFQVASVTSYAGHYHDTGGRALDNIEASLELGLRVFDSSVAGLGGCPYAPGAKGNVASEAVVRLAHEKGYATGIDEEKLAVAGAFAKNLRS